MDLPDRTTSIARMPRWRAVLVVVGAMLVLPACGVTAEDEAAPGSIATGDEVAEVAGPAAPQAAELADGSEALAEAWAPASERRPVLEAAWRLHLHAATSAAAQADQLERERALRLEVERSQAAVRGVATAVAAVSGAGAVEEARTQLVSAAEDRARALDVLAAALDEGAAASANAAWLEDWWRSLRATRSATTLLQEAREQADLEPMPEEAIR